MTGDLAAHVVGRDAGLGAQRWDDRLVEVGAGDGLGAHREQHVDALTGLAIDHRWLRRACDLPGLDRLAEQWVDRFGERDAGLVHGHVEQANGVLGEHVAGVGGDRGAVVLPTHATDP